jgi:hypothetical protein
VIDKEHLRRLALIARDDDRDEICQLRMTPSQLALATALDPTTVLELLDEAKVERASFESACDAAQELDARLARLVASWRERDRTGGYFVEGGAQLAECADELEALLKERR